MVPCHLVQFYDNDTDLLQSVRRFITEGLQKHESVIVVTNAQRRDAFFAGLDLSHSPGLIAVDSHSVLSRIMVDGRVDAASFHDVVGALVRGVAARARSRGMRVYGDMVDDLWNSGKPQEAVDLERYWNDLQAQIPFSLYCAYRI